MSAVPSRSLHVPYSAVYLHRSSHPQPPRCSRTLKSCFAYCWASPYLERQTSFSPKIYCPAAEPSRGMASARAVFHTHTQSCGFVGPGASGKRIGTSSQNAAGLVGPAKGDLVRLPEHFFPLAEELRLDSLLLGATFRYEVARRVQRSRHLVACGGLTSRSEQSRSRSGWRWLTLVAGNSLLQGHAHALNGGMKKVKVWLVWVGAERAAML
eukprot:CAMPEP_0179003882 /NCGR_PEP_ID=MMETSP0795-20121207/12954_1 /TAXON_ID=88552 /ORGANISM="Amoebophrya sp., Strain Ameob2" /LENGTH=210 /DNA_ID=CAMNT_0020697999 /DNA_START=680 /DNA_END=1313 /DNA_ORIENTATION=+